jgi:16S rRNA (guanine527-N7)-methyltransferase
MNAPALLTEGLHQLGLELDIEPFMTYLELLQKWNKAYNLTAIRSLDGMVSHHLLDSLAIMPWVNGPRLLDVGTGAGFPGIPLALAQPTLQVVLLDSNGKKIRFLREVKRTLKLNHVEIVQTRVEAYHPPSGFDTVTSRAFSAIDQFVQCTETVVAEQGIWLAMKGRYPEAELEHIHHPYRVETYTVPGNIGERCCIIINKESSWQRS